MYLYFCGGSTGYVNIVMQSDTKDLVLQGNNLRSQRQYEQALACYAQAFVENRANSAAWNNYGNVLREIGHPDQAIPFLEMALRLDPNSSVAAFNLAVCFLLLGDYKRGWAQYESRWNYEHLAGTLPKFTQPRWTGQDLRDKTILVVGEQGHGDNIQFSRFIWHLHQAGARIKFQVTLGLIPVFQSSDIIEMVTTYDQDPGDFDYWVPIMSIPGILGVTLENLPRTVCYLNAQKNLQDEWVRRLGPKHRMRVGFSWSGRRDTWLNTHKGMPISEMQDLIQRCPQYEWINLQADATPEETAQLEELGVRLFPGTITGFHDTAALMANLDVIISVDTAVAHLSGALGRPTFVMLQKFALDWRWLLNRNDSPWYSTAKLFRQKDYDDWRSVTRSVEKFLTFFKI